MLEVARRDVPTVRDEARHDPRSDAIGPRGTGDESKWHAIDGTGGTRAERGSAAGEFRLSTIARLPGRR